MIFRARQFKYVFPRPALVMGIVNVTPDSFSDGGCFATPQAAIAHGLQLAAEGADILDIGGESTRPNATPVSEADELARVIPVIEQLSAKLSIPISIDTMKPAVARAAIKAGASIINDVASNQRDPAMGRLAIESGAAYVLMHMKGTPRDMQENPTYADVVGDVKKFFNDRLNDLATLGVNPEQIIIDVGIGFGKRLEDNLQLIASLRQFTKWDRPILLGVSRKSFIGQLLGAPVNNRLPGSLACACWAVQNGVQFIRTHDVAATRQAIQMTEALMAKQ
jgi:dihydropteroate synthase